MIYEYRCLPCAYAFEYHFEGQYQPEPVCPRCGKDDDVARIPSSAAFVLRGGGWAADGYSGRKEGSDE